MNDYEMNDFNDNLKYSYSLNEHTKEMTIYLGCTNISVATISDVQSDEQAKDILEEYAAESEM